MTRRREEIWRSLADRQAGVLARRQLNGMGFDNDYVDNQLRARRWQRVGDVVVCTTTGPLSREQRTWAGVLHAGPTSAVGGLTALQLHGLSRWEHDPVTVVVAKSHNLAPLPGVEFVETRRPVLWYAAGRTALPVWRVEPAALLWAAYEPVTRSAYGLLAAVVQQGLTTPYQLDRWITRMRPLRRAKPFRRVLDELARGARSLAELDVTRMCRDAALPAPRRQTRRVDASGHNRYTDCEWRLADGRTVVLEVDGAFHMEVDHWEADLARQRDLVSSGVLVLRCTAGQLRQEPQKIAQALRRLGVGESSA